jgi:hypothetical protein
MDEPPDKELLYKDLFKIQAVAEIISDVESMSGFCPYNSENPAWYIVVGSAPANSICLSSSASSDRNFISGDPLP